MEKMKREWKRIVAIVLSVLMVSSTIDMSVFAASVSEETQVFSCKHHTEHTEDCGYAEAVSADAVMTYMTVEGGECLYLQPNSNWTQDSARFAAYFIGTGGAWESMTDSDGDGIYEVIVPAGSWTNVIFCRMNPGTSENSWDNKWNQSGDLTYDGINNLCTINEGLWDCGQGVTWSVYPHTHDFSSGQCVCGESCPHETYVNGSCAKCGAVDLLVESYIAEGSENVTVNADGSWKVSGDIAIVPNCTFDYNSLSYIQQNLAGTVPFSITLLDTDNHWINLYQNWGGDSYYSGGTHHVRTDSIKDVYNWNTVNNGWTNTGTATIRAIYIELSETGTVTLNTLRLSKESTTVGDATHSNGKYSATNESITGSCSVCDGGIGTVIISATGGTYNGSTFVATIIEDTIGITNPEIVYTATEGSCLTDGKPVNAGKYTASLTLGAGENAATASVSYEIEKAVLTLTGAEAMGREHDGTNIVAISDITLSGIVGTDDVSVQTNGLIGTLDSANAGTYNSVTLPALSLTGAAAGNYTLEQPSGAVTTSVTIAKKAAPTVDTINKSYLYSGENADAIDIARLLPADCGAAVYDVQTSGDIQYAGSVGVSNGVLNYTLAPGAVNTQGTVTVTATTDNYEDITITVNITLTEQIPVKLQEGTEVTLQNNMLTYGEPLSKLAFNNAVFVDDDGNVVAGTLAWKEPMATPNAGTTSATWVFTPDDSDYTSVEGTVDITVNKATPDVSVLPTVAEHVYNPEKSLMDSNMTGGRVLDVDGVDLEGIWSWENTATIPVANNSGYTAVFTPVDTANYEVITKTIAVPVTKATPFIVQMPAAESVSYGDALSASQLIGGAAICGNGAGEAGEEDDLGISMVIGVSQRQVAGRFVWKDGNSKPTVADSNTTPYMVVFIPDDTANYNTVEFSLTLTVGKAVAPSVMPPKTINAPYSQSTVGAVVLPAGWTWKETDKNTALTVGTPVTAKAVYTAADKDNFETTEVIVTITRVACGHVWNSGVITTKPTATKTGVKTYTCTDCGATRTETIAALGAPKKGTTLKDSKNKAYYKVTKAGLKNGTVEYVKPVNKKAATVSIPATIKADGITYKVTGIAKNAFKSNKKVTKVTIGSNVKTIGANAFYGCTKLKTLTIGKNVTTIGDKAFYKCTALTKVTIPFKVTKIGKSAFYGCKKLKTVTIKTTKLNNSRVGSNAFKGIYKKAVIKVPKAKVKSYTTLLQKKGIAKTATVKK